MPFITDSHGIIASVTPRFGSDILKECNKLVLFYFFVMEAVVIM